MFIAHFTRFNCDVSMKGTVQEPTLNLNGFKFDVENA